MRNVFLNRLAEADQLQPMLQALFGIATAKVAPRQRWHSQLVRHEEGYIAYVNPTGVYMVELFLRSISGLVRMGIIKKEYLDQLAADGYAAVYKKRAAADNADIAARIAAAKLAGKGATYAEGVMRTWRAYRSFVHRREEGFVAPFPEEFGAPPKLKVASKGKAPSILSQATPAIWHDWAQEYSVYLLQGAQSILGAWGAWYLSEESHATFDKSGRRTGAKGAVEYHVLGRTYLVPTPSYFGEGFRDALAEAFYGFESLAGALEITG